MKFILTLSLFFVLSNPSKANSAKAEFDNLGQVFLEDTAKGLKTSLNLQLEPWAHYLIKLQTSCEARQVREFRRSLEYDLKTRQNGEVKRSFYFMGVHSADLRSQNIQAIAIYVSDRTRWRSLQCSPLNSDFDSI
ncbi:hypothetical protein AZI87_13275 [Bdellovibrio bacteriovorus]|uniref:Uncharacterized protein n=1 Tax=Bdellovibrio bacteriovorus TaxID=959 RepID=A0A162G365_BDEBC|nr:hypothetical protein [Bdellovibrio bacteriovorus]KYG64210.1 hypothetical protein AZI87_13275 [Bdellovibrio bacteriovorus]